MMKKMGWSLGDGLGKSKSGTTTFIRVKKRRDNSGIGAKGKEDDKFHAMSGMFNHLLKRLRSKNPDGDDAEEADSLENSEGKGMEYKTSGARLKSFVTRKTLYGKFRAAKDTSRHTAADKAAIFGNRSYLTPGAGVFGKLAGKTSKAPEEEKAKKNDDFESDVMTTVSTTNIRDYFANKIKNSAKKSQFNAAGGQGFTLEQQSSYYMAMHNLNLSRSSRGGLGFGMEEDDGRGGRGASSPAASAASQKDYSSIPPPTALANSKDGGTGESAHDAPANGKTKKEKKKKKSKRKKLEEAAKNGDKQKKKKKKRKRAAEANGTDVAESGELQEKKNKNKNKKRKKEKSHEKEGVVAIMAVEDSKKAQEKKKKKMKKKKEKKGKVGGKKNKKGTKTLENAKSNVAEQEGQQNKKTGSSGDDPKKKTEKKKKMKKKKKKKKADKINQK